MLNPASSGSFPSFLDSFSPFQMMSCCYSFLVLHLSIVSQDISVFQVPGSTSEVPAVLLKYSITAYLKLEGTLKEPSSPTLCSLHRPNSQASSSQAGEHFLCQYLIPYHQVAIMAVTVSNPSTDLERRQHSVIFWHASMLTLKKRWKTCPEEEVEKKS